MCDLCLGRVTAEVVRHRDISNPCCIRLVKKPPHSHRLNTHQCSKQAPHACLKEPSMSSDAEISDISQRGFEALVHQRSRLAVRWRWRRLLLSQ